jgi:hypothetical protein
MTTKKNKPIKRTGSGRTKGSTSFQRVKLSELNRVLKPEAEVIVNRRYAETLGLKGCKPFIVTTQNIEGLANQVEFTVENL